MQGNVDTTFWRFLDAATDTSQAMGGVYNPFLVALSFLVASLAAFTALSVVERIGAVRSTESKIGWLVAGAAAMGSGIWSMHFIGMLAFSMGMPVAYDLSITLLSVVPGILASFSALYFMNRKHIGLWRLQLGGLLLAGGIGTMHYTGMEAMRMGAEMRYDPVVFFASLVIAHILATFALFVKFVLHKDGSGVGGWTIWASAGIMGAAVAGMHYTAMGAAYFFPAAATTVPAAGLKPQALAIAIGVVTISIMTLAIISTAIGRHFSRVSESLRKSEELSLLLLNAAGEGICGLDLQGEVTIANPAASRMVGYAADELIGYPMHSLLKCSQERADACGLDRHVMFLAMSDGRVRSGRDEILVRKDGTEVPIAYIATPVLEDGAITGAVITFDDITEQKRAEQVVARRTLESQLLHSAAEIATDAESFEVGLQAVVNLICEMTGWPVGHVYMPSPNDQGVLEPTTIWHLDSDSTFAVFQELTERTCFEIGEGLPGRVMKSGQPAWITNVHLDTNFPRNRLAADLGVKGAFAFPVTMGDETVAVLEFFSGREVDPDQNLLQIMANVGAQLGRVFERRKAVREVRAAREAAEAASRAKSDFLANMSHELRTPMNAIIGYSEMLIEEAEDLGQEDFVPDLKKIQGAGTHLLSLINDILDLSKIEAGKMELFLECFDVSQMIDQIESTVDALIKKNRNTLQVERGDALGEMHGDLTKVRQTLFNLISNAAKFTEDGVITLSIERKPGSACDEFHICVADTGIGIAADKLNSMFEEFSQADASTTRKYGGTGLGLAITRRFCEMMGGSIQVRSTPGQGTTFEMRLPATVTAVPGTEQAEAIVSAPRPQPIASTTSSRTVLVIDDDPGNCDLLVQCLAEEGFDAVIALDGLQGLRMARELHPLAITLDVMMPGMDGWAVLKALKADALLRDIPVVIVTMATLADRTATVDSRELGFTLGAAEYLTKPIDRRRLAEVLRRYRCDSPPCELLLVEDDGPTRELMRRTLEKAGWHVTEAENGKHAIDCLECSVPELIVLDLMMPVMDGFEFAFELRKKRAWRNIPIIVVTSKELTPADRARLSSYVESILQKGAFTRDELLEQVRDVVRGCAAAAGQGPM